MTRLVITPTLAVAVLLSMAPSAKADWELGPATSHERRPLRDTCRNRSPRGFVWCWAHRFGASPRKATCIAKRESGLNPRATNGTHHGLFQWAGRYWSSTKAQFPVVKRSVAPGIFNARTNSAFALRWQSTRGYGPWAGRGCGT